MMSSLANTILFIALVTTSIMVAVMYRKLRKLDRYHTEYQQIFDKTGVALTAAQKAVVSFGTEGKETLAQLSQRIEEAQAVANRLEHLTREARQETQPR
jgi:ABC-type transport system involved in cytochrome bd biosynthesis fused ATPase/permease subunit